MIPSGRSKRSSRRRLNFSSIIISSYCSAVPSLLNISILYATVVVGFAPRKHYHNHIIEDSLPTISLPSSMISPQRTTVHKRCYTSHTRRSTSLHVSWFDKFHLPYGVNTTTNDNDNVELLDALLPQLPTPEDKRRVMEGFQQARLSEQLRLSKNRNGINEEPKFLADDENTVSRMAELFQQARLSEQLRLSKIKGVYPSEDEVMNIDDDIMLHNDEDFDKVEMFQRALLEEQLKIRRLQRQKRQEQHRLVVSSSESIEKAMNEYEIEKEMHQMATMVRENETFDENENGDGTNGDDDIDAASIILSNLSTNGDNDDDGNSKASEGELLSVNETEPSHQLDIQLAKLHQMIAFATSFPGLDESVAISQRDTTSNSLQTFLSTTYLPLQPREDASVLSLVLAPVAHLLSSVFLFGAALFYGVMAVLDMIMNDTDTRACLKETGCVMKSCFGYVFPQSKMKVQEGVAKRTIKAFQISLVASFYALQGVFVRAARQSKYRHSCGDSATGALRYLVYALRSVKVIWNRVTNDVKRSFQESKVQSKPSLTSANARDNIKSRLHRVYSGMKGKFSGQRKGMEYQQDMQPDELHEQKLRLNQDRIVLERDKLQLQEAQRQLEYEKGKLLVDGLNVMAWYAAVEDKIGKDDGKKERWWRRK